MHAAPGAVVASLSCKVGGSPLWMFTRCSVGSGEQVPSAWVVFVGFAGLV